MKTRNSKMKNLSFKNPVRKLKVENWPAGNERVTAYFVVQVNRTHGERIWRMTVDSTGRKNKPKVTPWYLKCAIVEGSDGKHYTLSKTHLANVLTDANMRFPRYFYKADPEDLPYYNRIEEILCPPRKKSCKS